MCTVCLYVHMFFPPGSLLRYAAADETADYVLSQNWLSLSQNGYGCVCEYIYIHMYRSNRSDINNVIYTNLDEQKKWTYHTEIYWVFGSHQCNKKSTATHTDYITTLW